MSKFFASRCSVCNVIAAVLMVVLLVLHFTPFWQYGDNQEQATSIQGYIWFPSDNGSLDKYIKANADPDHSVDSILTMPILVLILGAVGAAFCLAKADQLWTGIFPAACGAVGLWGYLSKAAFQLGTNWVLHMIVCIALILIGIAVIYTGCAYYGVGNICCHNCTGNQQRCGFAKRHLYYV